MVYDPHPPEDKENDKTTIVPIRTNRMVGSAYPPWRPNQTRMPELAAELCLYLDIQSLTNLRLVNQFWTMEATRELSLRRPIMSRLSGIENESLFRNFAEIFRRDGRQFDARFEYVITFGLRSSAEVHNRKKMFFTTFLREEGIHLKSLVVQVHNWEVFEAEKDLLDCIFTTHKNTIEVLTIQVLLRKQTGVRSGPLLPTTVRLPRVRRLTVSMACSFSRGVAAHMDESIVSQIVQLGNELSNILPSLETMTVITASLPLLLQDFLLNGLFEDLRRLVVSNRGRPKMFPLSGGPLQSLSQLTVGFDFLLFHQNNQNIRMEEIRQTLLRSPCLKELSLEFRLFGHARDMDVVVIPIPPMKGLKRLRLTFADEGYEDRNRSRTIVKMELKTMRVIDVPLEYTWSLPVLEEILVLEEKHGGKLDCTQVLEQLFPHNGNALSHSLKWVIIPDKHELSKIGLTQEILKQEFPNLLKFQNQSMQTLIGECD